MSQMPKELQSKRDELVFKCKEKYFILFAVIEICEEIKQSFNACFELMSARESKLREVIEMQIQCFTIISKNSCCDNCQEVKRVARKVLECTDKMMKEIE